MIICSCNVISEKEFREVAPRACGSTIACYGLLGHSPQCGGCMKKVKEIVDEAAAEAARQPQDAETTGDNPQRR